DRWSPRKRSAAPQATLKSKLSWPVGSRAPASLSNGALVIQYAFGGAANNDLWQISRLADGYFKMRLRRALLCTEHAVNGEPIAELGIAVLRLVARMARGVRGRNPRDCDLGPRRERMRARATRARTLAAKTSSIHELKRTQPRGPLPDPHSFRVASIGM